MAGIIGSRIFASQWSHISAQPAAVIENAGKLFLPQLDSSLLSYSLKVGVEKRTSRSRLSAAWRSISATRAASNSASSSSSIACRDSSQFMSTPV